MISDHFNSGNFADVWTCENFYLEPLAFYPNWDRYPNADPGRLWQMLGDRFAELQESGLHRLDAIRHLHNEGLIRYHSTGEIRGSCKVGGNEFNAAIVYAALLMISAETNSVISLTDEGEYLLIPLLLKNGLAKPWPQRVKEDWSHWQKQGFIRKNTYGLADKQQLQAELLKNFPDFADPESFCRDVQRKDFKAHPQYDGSQILAGFYGEYWNLNGDFDPEMESLSLSALLQGLARESGLTLSCGKSFS